MHIPLGPFQLICTVKEESTFLLATKGLLPPVQRLQSRNLPQASLKGGTNLTCFPTSEVLNSSPHAPCSAYFACLSLLTHLIQIISLLEVRSMHELCSD